MLLPFLSFMATNYLKMSFQPLDLWLSVKIISENDKQSIIKTYEDIVSTYGANIENVLIEGEIELPQDIFEDFPRTKKSFYIDKNNKLSCDDKIIGASITISSTSTQSDALALVGSVEYLLISCTDWRMQYVPIENLVSACSHSGTKLVIRIDSVEQIPGVAFALQLGADALLIGADITLWKHAYIPYTQRREKHSSSNPSLSSTTTIPTETDAADHVFEECEVTGVKVGSTGDRVCLDCTRLLQGNEAALVGSSAKALIPVLGETAPSDFVPARPFRINAGPVHSYVLMADGSTKYLSEVEAGDAIAIAVYDDKKETASFSLSSAFVGRSKIEPRPLVLVSFKSCNPKCNKESQIFLQQAETVRLLTPKDTLPLEEVEKNVLQLELQEKTSYGAISVTRVKPGQKIFVRFLDLGTHVGKRIFASVREK